MCLLKMEGKYAAMDTDGTQLLTYVTVGKANPNVKELYYNRQLRLSAQDIPFTFVGLYFHDASSFYQP